MAEALGAFDRGGLRQELEAYARREPARAVVVARLLELLQQPGDVFGRAHLDPGHFTASAFVLCPERRRLLLIRHPKLGRWLQPGGHIEACDGSCRAAAEREVCEETGVAGLEPLEPGIFDVDVHLIPPSSREGAHQHFDVRYAFLASSERLVASDEVKAARWVELSAVAALNDEESIARCVRGVTLSFCDPSVASRLFSGQGRR